MHSRACCNFKGGLASRDFRQNPLDFASAAPTMHRNCTKNLYKFFGAAPEARKFSIWAILEVPLIVLQYYKPSFSIYIYKEGSFYIYKYYNLFINIYKLKFTNLIPKTY
jgi:hypothetical protein